MKLFFELLGDAVGVTAIAIIVWVLLLAAHAVGG